MGATLHRGARASHYRGLSCCGAQAPDAQAQELWLMGLVALRHVGSSQTRARTRVPCISRQILNHCATRETLNTILILEISHTRVEKGWRVFISATRGRRSGWRDGRGTSVSSYHQTDGYVKPVFVKCLLPARLCKRSQGNLTERLNIFLPFEEFTI